MPNQNVDSIVLSQTTITLIKGKFFYLSFIASYKGKQVSFFNYRLNVSNKKVINAQYYGQTIAILGESIGTSTLSVVAGPIESNVATIHVVSSSALKRYFSSFYFSAKYFASKFFA